MADPCVGCGNTAIHPFEGLVRSIMDGERYSVHCMPPLQSLHGECKGCDWSTMHRVMAEYCPRCGRPTRLLSREEAEAEGVSIKEVVNRALRVYFERKKHGTAL